MLHTISARQLQKSYRKILDKVNKLNKPLIVITNNKPIAAIISLKLLEEIDSRMSLKELEEESDEIIRKGEYEVIDTPEKLEAEFEEMRKVARST